MNLYLMAIGINEYFDEAIPNLEFAENDARDIYSVFSAAVSKKSFHGRLLTGRQATLAQIKACAGDWIAKKAKKNDAVLIYFAGHGAVETLPGADHRKDTSNYLVPYDAMVEGLYSSAFSLTKELPILLERIAAQHITVVLDCCFSGGSNYRGARGIEGFNLRIARLTTGTDPTSRVVGVAGKRVELGIGRLILMACGPDQVAIESSELGNGIFTHFLMRVISAQAGESYISSALVHDEVSKAVLSYTNGSQCPVLEGRLQGHRIIVRA
jgi:uncharacterized caspase-like protein